MSFASCQFGENRCTNCASSSKQNKKKRCGYQCRQKCQNFCDAVKSACFRDSVCASMRFGFRADLASIVQSSKIIIATSACRAISRSGCFKFSANKEIKALETPKYAKAIHSNAPQADQAAASSDCRNLSIPARFKTSALGGPVPTASSAFSAITSRFS